MRIRIAILVLTLAIQLSLAFLPKIPFFRDTLPSDPVQRQAIDATMLLVGLSLAAIGLAYNLNAIAQEQSAEKLRSRIESALPLVEIKKQRDDEFYVSFQNAVRLATSTVNICYFAPTPPTVDPDEERQRYYRALESLMRNKKNVNFRRLVRLTKANREWVKGLARSFKDKSNVSIAVLDEVEVEEMPLALSVQVVDGVSSWMVAIEAHNRTGEYRDLFVRNAVFAEAMTKYFDRLWNRSVVVLDGGRVRDSALLE